MRSIVGIGHMKQKRGKVKAKVRIEVACLDDEEVETVVWEVAEQLGDGDLRPVPDV